MERLHAGHRGRFIRSGRGHAERLGRCGQGDSGGWTYRKDWLRARVCEEFRPNWPRSALSETLDDCATSQQFAPGRDIGRAKLWCIRSIPSAVRKHHHGVSNISTTMASYQDPYQAVCMEASSTGGCRQGLEPTGNATSAARPPVSSHPYMSKVLSVQVRPGGACQ